jgi:hypothetical protein
MSQMYILLIIGCAIMWFVGIFFTFVSGIKKGAQNIPRIEASQTSGSSKSLAQEAEEQRKRLVDDRQDFIKRNYSK